jgi:CheY-like chemotaxis protein
LTGVASNAKTERKDASDSPARMNVVIADDDSITRRLLEHAARSNPNTNVVGVSDGEAALASCRDEPAPDVLVLDWEMPGMTGLEVCRRVRSSKLATVPYLLIVTVRNGREDVIAALNAGADDVLSKPIAPDLFRARLRLAARRRGGRLESSARIVRALMDAVQEQNGELLIRDGEVAARVYFCRGRIGWAELSNESGSLVDMLSPISEVDSDTARAVLEECQNRRAPLADVLIEWGLLDRGQLRSCLQLWITRKLALMRGLANPSTLFLPGVRECVDELSFELSDVVSPELLGATRASLPPGSMPNPPRAAWSEAFVLAEAPGPSASALLQSCSTIQGFQAVALLEPSTGVCLGHVGRELNPDIAWAMIQNLSVVARHERTESSLLTTERHFHLLCEVNQAPLAVAYAVFDREQTSLASAWLSLRATIANAS